MNKKVVRDHIVIHPTRLDRPVQGAGGLARLCNKKKTKWGGLVTQGYAKARYARVASALVL